MPRPRPRRTLPAESKEAICVDRGRLRVFLPFLLREISRRRQDRDQDRLRASEWDGFLKSSMRASSRVRTRIYTTDGSRIQHGDRVGALPWRDISASYSVRAFLLTERRKNSRSMRTRMYICTYAHIRPHAKIARE